MLLDDPLEDRRIAARVPRALRVDDGDRSALADAEAIRFRAQDAALLRQPELLEAPFEELPRREAAFLLAALRIRLVAAEKDVPPRARDADRLRDRALRVSRHRRSDAELFRIPLEAELVRRRHVTDDRGRGDDRGAREVAFAADAHAILPVAIERRDRALAGVQRVRPLAEAR